MKTWAILHRYAGWPESIPLILHKKAVFLQQVHEKMLGMNSKCSDQPALMNNHSYR